MSALALNCMMLVIELEYIRIMCDELLLLFDAHSFVFTQTSLFYVRFFLSPDFVLYFCAIFFLYILYVLLCTHGSWLLFP